MRRSIVVAACVLCSLAGGTTARAAGAYTYSLIVVGNYSIYANAINASDQVAGHFTDTNQVSHGFVDTAGVFRSFDPPAGTIYTGTYAINKGGLVTASYGTPAHATRAITYRSRTGTPTKISVHGASSVYPYGVNDSGAVVGTAVLSDRPAPHGFLRSGGVVTVFDPPGSTSTTAHAIGNDGTVVGSYYSADGASHGFTYRAGAYSVIDAPGGVSTYATGINGSGTIVGYDRNSAGNTVGWTKNRNHFTFYSFPAATRGTTVVRALGGGQVIGTWYDGLNQHAYHFVGGTYYDLAPAGTMRMQVADVNARGDFTGVYYDLNNGVHPFLATCRPNGAACQQ